MKMRLFLFLLLVAIGCHTASGYQHEHEFGRYSLSYEALVDRNVISIDQTDKEDSNDVNDNKNEAKGYEMFTDLATEIATDIIQLYTDTTDSASSTSRSSRKLEMDLRCYETTMMGGESGRCNIDHARKGEVTIQIVVSYETYETYADESTSEISTIIIIIRVEATIAAKDTTARNILVQSIPMINKQLQLQQQQQTQLAGDSNQRSAFLWSIHQRPTPALFQTMKPQVPLRADHASSLEKMILERQDLHQRMRIASSNKGNSLEVWQHIEQGSLPIRSIFSNGNLLSTTHTSSAAHAEALVHPALISIDVIPELILIISSEPTAILKEVLKHRRVLSVVLLGVDLDALALAEKYLPFNNDCSFIANPAAGGKQQDSSDVTATCLSQPNVILIKNETISEWLTSFNADTSKVLPNVILVDVPPEKEESLLSSDIQSKLREIVSDDAIVVLASGATPKLLDTHELDKRHALLRSATESSSRGGLEYYQVYNYDEVR